MSILHGSELDSTIFGAVNSKIADRFSDSIDAALDKGVATLPCLEKEKQQAMKDLLRKKYLRNVDAFEIYCKRNIFTLCEQTPMRQQEILRRFQELPEGHVPEEILAPEASPEGDDVSPDYPSLTDIPSPEELAALESEMKQLRQQSFDLHQKRAQLQHAGKSWEAAEQLASLASENLVCINKEHVMEQVSHIVQQQHGLVDCHEQGKELLEEMDHAKRERPQGDDEDDDIRIFGPPPKKMTVDEQFQDLKSKFTNENELNKVHAILTKGNINTDNADN
jgi:hypothetical protein